MFSALRPARHARYFRSAHPFSGDPLTTFGSAEINDFEPLATLAELGEGMIVPRVKSSGEAICLIRVRGEVSAVSGICTHEHYSMAQGDLLPDGTIQCAWHGARFDRLTGEVKQVPATAPLPIYRVKIDGETVLVGGRCERTGPRYEASVGKAGDGA